MGWLKKVWLKIWNKIKYLFGKRKMEIDETINKWFKETEHQMRNSITHFDSIDGLCTCILQRAKDYCNAILLLLSKDHKMPAKALLRVLCELFVKLAWCLSVPDNQIQNEDQIVKEKIRRWEKSTLCNNIRISEKFFDVSSEVTKKKIRNSIDKLKGEPLYNNTGVKEMPKFLDIIYQLPDPFIIKVHPLLYLQFNNAVHLDVTSFVDSYLEEDQITCQNISSSGDLVKFCIDHAFHINSLIRLNYKCKTEQIRNEYQEMMEKVYDRK